MGWVVLDKASQTPSSWMTHRVKKLFQANKAGHAGTLDPLASGLLPIALNQATRLIPFLMHYPKTYTFTVFWGHETTTEDVLGEKIEGQNGHCPPYDQIDRIVDAFKGTLSQRPPSYSAVKLKGVCAYRYARQGQNLILPEKSVTIFGLKVVEHRGQETDFEVSCSTGTYVRALARDMARALGTYGHIVALRRTSVGPFSQGHCMTDLSAESYVYPPESVLGHLPKIDLEPKDVLALWQGRHVSTDPGGVPDGCIACYDEKNQLVALALKNQTELKPQCSFIRT